MDPAILTQVVTALTIIARIVDSLGVGGVIALALAGPVIVVLAVMGISYLNGLKLARIIESYRADADSRFEAYRKDSEEYRKDAERRFERFRDAMGETLTQFGRSQAETAQFYRDNVEPVKVSNRLATGFQDVVVTNTAALERVGGLIENNMFCPVAREGSRGKK